MIKKSIISILLFLFSSASAQEIMNNDFSLVCDNSESKFCSWDVSWGKNPTSVGTEGENIFLQIEGLSENSVGFVEQEILIERSDQLRILTLTGSVQSKAIKGKGAGLNISFFDQKNNLLSSKDMGGFYSTEWVKGTQGWTVLRLKAICPTGTKRIKIGAILYGSGVASFDEFSMSLNPAEIGNKNQLAKDYIKEIITIVQDHSLYRDSLDFEDLYQKSISIAGNSNAASDFHISVDFILSELARYGDNHSFFMTPEEVKNWETPISSDGGIQLPEYRMMEEYGYIEVPPFHGGNDSLIMKYAKSLQEGIKRLSDKKVDGWIIDLRENTGGNMEPMITGLGPLFSSDSLGALIDINGIFEYWKYKNGTYYWEDEEILSVTNYTKLHKKSPIVVLIGNQTGSSGEIVAISFKGNLNTVLIGENTWGLTTGNGDFELTDGAKLFLASTKMVDRNGRIYNSTIEPDIRVLNKNSDQDLVLLEAIKWLKNQY